MIPLYIFDLDGTLALVEHRRHLVHGKCQSCSGTGEIDRPEPVPVAINADAPINDQQECGLRFFTDPCPVCAGTGTTKPNWPAFFKACVHDTPNWPVIGTMHALLKAGADVQIWSGRSAEVMNETLAWLQANVFTDGAVDPDEVGLTMRREGDYTPDDQLKAAWYDAMSAFDKKRLVAIFDDRQKVVDMWRSKGVACFQVAPGEF